MSMQRDEILPACIFNLADNTILLNFRIHLLLSNLTKHMMKRAKNTYTIEENIIESTMPAGISISRNLSIDQLEALREGQLVTDEKGMSAILLNVEIKSRPNEKHVYLKLSSCPKTILIIK